MARPREFDEQQVLDRALETFWQKGYEGTSVEDLVQATGLGRASLYGAFGDKEKLFARVLEHYRAQVVDIGGVVAQSASPKAALEALLHAWLAGACPRKGARGCFLVLSGTAGDCPSFAREALRAGVDGMERSLADLVRRGQECGEFDRRADPMAQARLLVMVVQGMYSTARIGWGKDRLESVMHEIFSQVLAKT